jgi:hypothetical protein
VSLEGWRLQVDQIRAPVDALSSEYGIREETNLTAHRKSLCWGEGGGSMG